MRFGAVGVDRREKHMEKKLNVVTGAKGYVGYALVKELADRGERIRLSLHRDSHDFDEFNCEKVIGDVCSLDHLMQAFEGADTVYHVAGLVDITGKKDDLVWKVNYDGTKAVVEACKKCGVKNLVYVSSVDAIHVTDDMTVVREPDHFDPDLVNGAYGKSKAAASQYVMDSSDENLKTCVVHPSCCIGPYDVKGTASVCAMIRLYIKGLFPVTLDFGAYNFVDVRDVAKGMIGAAEKGRGGQNYLLCGDKLTVREFIATLAKICGRKPPKVALSKKTIIRLLPVIVKVFDMLKLPPVLNEMSIEILCQNCNFTYEKAAKEFGYKPMSAEDSLRDTIEWIKKFDKEKANKK
mgnify:CR=1 FL=1